MISRVSPRSSSTLQGSYLPSPSAGTCLISLVYVVLPRSLFLHLPSLLGSRCCISAGHWSNLLHISLLFLSIRPDFEQLDEPCLPTYDLIHALTTLVDTLNTRTRNIRPICIYICVLIYRTSPESYYLGAPLYHFTLHGS